VNITEVTTDVTPLIGSMNQLAFQGVCGIAARIEDEDQVDWLIKTVVR
jgi:hypothetical protein